jgi:hypothetical protein
LADAGEYALLICGASLYFYPPKLVPEILEALRANPMIEIKRAVSLMQRIWNGV